MATADGAIPMPMPMPNDGSSHVPGDAERPPLSRSGSRESVGGSGFQSSGKAFKTLHKNSGATERLDGAEKLDILGWITERIDKCIQSGTKTSIKLEDLKDFLVTEGELDAGAKVDAPAIVQALYALRRRHLERLAYDSSNNKKDLEELKTMENALVLIPGEKVADVFCTDMVGVGGVRDMEW